MVECFRSVSTNPISPYIAVHNNRSRWWNASDLLSTNPISPYIAVDPLIKSLVGTIILVGFGKMLGKISMCHRIVLYCINYDVCTAVMGVCEMCISSLQLCAES